MPRLHQGLLATIPVALFAGAVLAQFADRLSADTIALAATREGASARIVAALVAAQAAAWLLVSLPAGVWVDRLGPRRLIAIGGLLIATGSLATAALLLLAPAGLALAPFAMLSASGMVMVALAAIVMVPLAVADPAEIPRANARIELGRAVVTLTASLFAGWAVGFGQPALALLACAVAGIAVRLAAGKLQDRRPAVRRRQSIGREIAEGATFVARHAQLRPIALCAIAWNLAFFAFMALLAPYAARVLALGPQAIGQASAAYGLGLLGGAGLAGLLTARLRTGVLLVFGPASSVVAAVCVALAAPASGWPVVALASFLFGFGPIIWFIVQNSLRQLVTPPELLGQVSATLTLAIYGMRPIGALLGGAFAEAFGLSAAIWLPVALFIASTAAILLSKLRSLTRLPEPITPRAAG